MRDKYGDERRTDISAVSGEVDIEDLIPVEDCVLTLTRMGYIKRQAADSYKTQRRGGRGIMGMATRDEDVPETMFLCSSHDYVMFFTSEGRVYRLKCYEVPEGSRTSKGMNVVNLLPLASEEKVTAMIHVSQFDGEADQYLCMVTRRGIIKRTRLNAYQNARKNGLIAIDLDEGDELAWVRVTDGYQRLIVGTRKGMAICFDENDARVVGRAARGVKALTLQEGDEVIGMTVCREGGQLLTVTETGYGRRSELSDYRIQSRGGKGLTNYHTEEFGDVAAIKVVDENDDIMVISSDGIVIRTRVSEVRLCRRPAKGVRVMKVEDGSHVVALVRASAETAEEETNTGEIEGSSEAGGEAPSPKTVDVEQVLSGEAFEEPETGDPS